MIQSNVRHACNNQFLYSSVLSFHSSVTCPMSITGVSWIWLLPLPFSSTSSMGVADEGVGVAPNATASLRILGDWFFVSAILYARSIGLKRSALLESHLGMGNWNGHMRLMIMNDIRAPGTVQRPTGACSSCRLGPELFPMRSRHFYNKCMSSWTCGHMQERTIFGQ